MTTTMHVSRRAAVAAVVAAATALGLVASTGTGATAAPAPERTSVRVGASAVNPVTGWQQVSAGGLSAIYPPGLVRVGNNLLVVWRRDDSSTSSSVRSRFISAAGALGVATPVVTGWEGPSEYIAPVTSPATGTRVVFGGIRSLDPSEQYPGQMAGALWNGTGWTFDTNSFSQSKSAYGSYGTDAVVYGGQVLNVFALNSDLTFHLGSDAGHPATTPDVVHTEPAGTSAYYTSLTTDPTTGKVWAAWMTLNNSTPAYSGIRYAQVEPTLGPATTVPGSHDATGGVVQSDQTVALAGVATGPWVAYLVGYPSASYIRLYNLVSHRTIVVPGSAGALRPTLTAAPGGRLWVAWRTQYTNQIHVTRTNTSVSRFEPVQTLLTPDWSTMMAGDGTLGPLDLVVNTPVKYSSSHVELLYRRVQPQLFATVKVVRGKATVVVTDAGLPVPGATVTYLKAHAATNAKGVAVITVGTKKGVRVIKVTKTGYAAWIVKVKV